MRELSVAEQRYQAVMAVIGDGLSVSQAAEKTGVARQTLHRWLARYEAAGLEGLADRSHRPVSCPHQMPAEVEAKMLELRRSRPYWGPRRLVFELAKRGIDPVPSESAVYRALVRAGLIDPAVRDRRSRKWKRWERGAPMELWQMDIVGGFPLADGTSAKALTGIDDHSRMCVCARLMARERTRAVCEGLRAALAAYGAPQQILTDNGKVFTGRFFHPPVEVLFDAICREHGIEHLLTQPRSPTTTGKIERFHRSLRIEFLSGRVFDDLASAQADLDAWVDDYNTNRPHRGIGMATPAQRFSTPQPPRAPELDAHLGALDEARDPNEWITRKVSVNGVITVAWQQISVGRQREGRRVDVHVLAEILEVWDGNELLKTVARTNKGGIRKKRAASR